jgi:hypothetical protein
MIDPVCTADGFTYEHIEAISEWLYTKDTSPVTGATLESRVLILNHLVRCLLRVIVCLQRYERGAFDIIIVACGPLWM